MPDKLTRGLLAVLLLVVLYQTYAIHELEEKVAWTATVASASSRPVQDLNPPLLAIQKNQASIIGGLAYLELLAEGLARKAALPVDRARAVFEARPGGVPAGWTWNPAWEDGAGSQAPAPATPAAP